MVVCVLASAIGAVVRMMQGAWSRAGVSAGATTALTTAAPTTMSEDDPIGDGLVPSAPPDTHCPAHPVLASGGADRGGGNSMQQHHQHHNANAFLPGAFDRTFDLGSQPPKVLPKPAAPVLMAAELCDLERGGDVAVGGPNADDDDHSNHHLTREQMRRRSELLLAPYASTTAETTIPADELLARRLRCMSRAQSVSYANTDPLVIVKGHGQFLVDVEGRSFLDTRNNVCHVGHCNNAVAKAVQRQVHTLNTNTRYLHPHVVELAEQLLATMPGPLRDDAVVFFVNSGSEANDLALRLARCHTKCRETIAVEHGYHGHTCAVVACSPYKCRHPRFQEPSDHKTRTHVVPAPDTYRIHPSIKAAYDERCMHACMPTTSPHTTATATATATKVTTTATDATVISDSSDGGGRGGSGANATGNAHANVSSAMRDQTNANRTNTTDTIDTNSTTATAARVSKTPLPPQHDTASARLSPSPSSASSSRSSSVVDTREDEELLGALYAESVEAVARERAGKLACMIVESGMSVAGVLLPPPGYLSRCFAAVRAAGGVCIVDEVQTGFARLGTSYWAFQLHNKNESSNDSHDSHNSSNGSNDTTTALHKDNGGDGGDDGDNHGTHGDDEADTTTHAAVATHDPADDDVIPDIVTVGKPFGNGMPLAAVVCRKAIAASFERGPEYFNTFGGNPVCCAAGLAVMEQTTADHAGRCFIGDIRGQGLFIGIDFVNDTHTRAPGTREASFVCTRLKDDHHILTSLDGPGDNVMVINPPMVFPLVDVERFVRALERAIHACWQHPASAWRAGAEVTPT
ncbi:alanine-glyoxylate aminotransferase 2-like 1 [Salpingoeca rosetta]|uniref:Alanine-glyoxylate aminotransferase 2-like 1 n=1 Tax=Salpingoeca rosetta (strain ATCC 50818 / BSB-021) TaxID=946362 RepID=F2TXT5_SALR5|nr:alanine-glyoxylate aminotransferase 2-like 1 [Salpingoeca rosetta]EGD76194.1 alanine-glyoxylate aminotransferase 2-like 1 [Salpingoeca rosetta]|eukprot:XP_004998369.1 alanine-glyoxylate aminotransferase 2-like 1 [Salpingoeca rosetta]